MLHAKGQRGGDAKEQNGLFYILSGHEMFIDKPV